MFDSSKIIPPHNGAPILTSGPKLDDSSIPMILVHGRGAGAGDILSLSQLFDNKNLFCIAPQAANLTWYPYRFIEEDEKNEPGISSGLALIGNIVDSLINFGIPQSRILLLGFSQGACLVLEYAAKNPVRYGGIFGLSGGLIGHDVTQKKYYGDFDGTPVFLGCDENDFHIPIERVHQSEKILLDLGASVNKKIYSGIGHTIVNDELENISSIINLL